MYFCEIRLKSMRLKPGMNPWYQLKDSQEMLRSYRRLNGLAPGDAVVELTVPTIIVTSSVELADLMKFYDIELTNNVYEDDPDYLPGMENWAPRFWIYKTTVGRLAPHIDYWYQTKQNEEREGRKGELMYNWSKVMMNSVYGRMSMRPDRPTVELTYDDELEWYKWTTHHKEKQYIEKFESYIPYGSCVTAWARHNLLDAWLKVGCENVIHSDTDSVIFFGKEVPKTLSVTGNFEGTDGSQLNSWGNEQPEKYRGADGKKYEIPCSSTIKAIVEGGKKRYVELRSWPIQSFDDISCAIAGVPQTKLKFDTKKDDDKGNRIYVRYPAGMWVEVLDDPSVLVKNKPGEPYMLGSPDYCIKSQWLRDLYKQVGQDPDHVNTMKLKRKQSKGGVRLEGETYDLNDNFMTWKLKG